MRINVQSNWKGSTMRNFILVIVFFCASSAMAKLKIVTTTPDLAAIARRIAGDKVAVTAIVKGTQDPHQIEAKPSFMIQLRDADMVIAHGLDLESAWLAPLIEGSRNPKIAVGSHGYLEVGAQIQPIEVHTGAVSRAEGDVHPGGNPHFQLDPVRLGLAAEVIANRLGELDSTNAGYYKKQAAGWKAELEHATKAWLARIKKSGVTEIVTYHKTLGYFCARFELRCEVQLEPRPGIPPTASHLLEVLSEIKKRHIPLVLVENYYDLDSADKLKSGVPELKVVEVPVSVGGEKAISTNEQLIERLVSEVEKAKK
jgi:zinc/manganese transport system substrate-binding protein